MSTSYHFSSSSTYYYQETPPITASIPIHFPTPPPAPIPVQFPTSTLTSAATKIQSAYRAHLVRSLLRRLLAVRSAAERTERLIQRQETVDAVRSDERERIRLNERLMALLLELDSVPGRFDPNVRELRRDLSRRIVGMQEVLDGIVAGTGTDGGYCEEVPGSWGELVEKIWAGEEEEDTEDETRFGCGEVSSCYEYVYSIIT